jgi:hypothetical protein
MNELKINQERYNEIIHKTYPALMEKLENITNELKQFIWDLRLIIEKNKDEDEN